MFHNTTKKRGSYNYKRLADGPFIRIFVLYPGLNTDPLRGHLEISDVHTCDQYEPLSYFWGDPRRSHNITCDGRSLNLTKSLDGALRRVRQLDQPRRIWVDQVCINQDNTTERNHQIQFMNTIYKNAHRVLVWLGSDEKGIARLSFRLLDDLDTTFKDEKTKEDFRIKYAEGLIEQSPDQFALLKDLIALPWFSRAWIVQEIGTKAPATLFWGAEELDWEVLQRVTEELNYLHHVRVHFGIGSAGIRYLYRRFIEADKSSRLANRFNPIYELHRARQLQVTDPRDRVFAFLGRYSFQTGNERLMEIRADYDKTTMQVYTEVAERGLLGDPDRTLIILAAVQHSYLRPSTTNRRLSQLPGNGTLPSWVPDWRIHESKILSEPISPHWAHGKKPSVVKICGEGRVLNVRGVIVDSISACSAPIEDKDFHIEQSRQPPAVESLWKNICGKARFDLSERYINGETALFAFMQTLSNGCVVTASHDGRGYQITREHEWMADGSAYLAKALEGSELVSNKVREIATKGDRYKWARATIGASTHRSFGRTMQGYYVLGPKVMEIGDLVCVLYGGKMPFVLRPQGDYFLLAGECYVRGLMNGEVIGMVEKRVLVEDMICIA